MTCFLVLGLPRSGTNCVAGILHHLGIPMGKSFREPDIWQPKGWFQDPEFNDVYHVIDKMEFRTHDFTSLKALMDRRFAEYPIWGFKSHLTQWFLWNIVEAYDQKVKIILVERPFHETIQSWSARKNLNIEESIIELSRYQYVLSEALEHSRLSGIEMLSVDYLGLLTNSKSVITTIASFCNRSITKEAVQSVDPKLRRFGRW